MKPILLKKTEENAISHFKELTGPYKELFSYYRCAMMEIETRFNILNESFSVLYDRNPIESIKTRLKTPESILNKLDRYDFPVNLKSVEENLNDVAGVRVICAYPSDVYRLADALLAQDDITLIRRKDYIANPKPNGYRSLHLIISVPIFLHGDKKVMKVEVQIRTMAMDWWASLEHDIRYKHQNKNISEQIEKELFECAEMSDALDRRMEYINDMVQD